MLNSSAACLSWVPASHYWQSAAAGFLGFIWQKIWNNKLLNILCRIYTFFLSPLKKDRASILLTLSSLAELGKEINSMNIYAASLGLYSSAIRDINTSRLARVGERKVFGRKMDLDAAVLAVWAEGCPASSLAGTGEKGEEGTVRIERYRTRALLHMGQEASQYPENFGWKIREVQLFGLWVWRSLKD